METLVILPTYNEAQNLPPMAEALFGLDLDLGLLVVDDASPDGTGDLAEALKDKYPAIMVLHRAGKLGLGSAYREGFKFGLEQTGAPYLAQMDADFSHDPKSLPALLDAARQGVVAVGSRYVPGGGTSNWGLGRRLLSRGGSFYARTALGLPLNDVTGGFKCWPRRVLESIDLADVRSDGYAFQAEMSFRAHRAGFGFKEVPITFEDRRVGQSKMSAGIALEALWVVWWLRFSTGSSRK